MASRWQTVTNRQATKSVSQALLKCLVDSKGNHLPSEHEVMYSEYTDPVTRELIIRIIPHTGVSPR